MKGKLLSKNFDSHTKVIHYPREYAIKAFLGLMPRENKLKCFPSAV
jgi:hypothetical protein